MLLCYKVYGVLLNIIKLFIKWTERNSLIMEQSIFLKELRAIAAKIDEKIAQLLLPSFSPNADILFDAIKYSVISASKKIRGFLLVKTADIFGVDCHQSIKIAAAIEMIHTYSLIHDDLPALDNDDYRRGKPSCHKKFGEAVAILAGDGLLSYAFEVLASDKDDITPQIRINIMQEVARAIGIYGMIGGQMIDINTKSINYKTMKEVHILKTARLITAACISGAILGNANQDQIKALRSYAEKLGLIFQMIDDLIDTADDQEKNNMNLSNLITVNEIKAEIKNLQLNAFHDLNNLDKTGFLKSLLNYIIEQYK